MAWNGSGVFTRTNGTNTGSTVWADDKAAAVKITTDRHDTHDQDIATAINACLTQNNESKPTANFLPNADNSYNLGSAGATWASGFFSGDVVIEERADHANTPSAGLGQLWVKSDAPCSLNFTDDAGDDHVLSRPATVSGHIRAGNMQLLSELVPADAVDIKTLVTENTFETFGPTGSGATNIWDALDVIPSSGAVLLANLSFSMTSTDTGSNGIEIFATDGSSSPTPSTSPIAAHLFDDDRASDFVNITLQVMIPMNSSQIFKITWRESGNPTTAVSLNYRGFITD